MDDDRSTLTRVRRDAIELPTLRIVAVDPDARVSMHPLTVGVVVVGSGEDCDVCLRDPEISRRHCELRVMEDGVRVRDVGSKNGIYVGSARVVDAVIAPGEAVLLGKSRLHVQVEGPSTVIPLSTQARFGDAVGGSLAMRALFAQLERVAPADETVLLLGESGTGKEVLARAIHARSRRAQGPFVVCDCAALAPGVAESELFGHVRGAFTGAAAEQKGLLEQANGGTLFIDEIGELPLDLQPKLLRALESQELRPVGASSYRAFDARVVAATHRDLRAQVAARLFREDLYYRLAVVEARVPALRERQGDIPLLVDRFLQERAPGMTLHDVPAHVLRLLEGHDWPGNVRELRNTVARLVLFPDAAALPQAAGGPAVGGATSSAYALPWRQARDLVLGDFEARYIRHKLDEHGGNVTRAAEAMGVSRQFLHRLIERYDLRIR
jgi:transcriptional regulator with PAS, ATPase and Fis domain